MEMKIDNLLLLNDSQFHIHVVEELLEIGLNFIEEIDDCFTRILLFTFDSTQQKHFLSISITGNYPSFQPIFTVELPILLDFENACKFGIAYCFKIFVAAINKLEPYFKVLSSIFLHLFIKK
jgi:hypothetical protein